jgi:hypothetical protein
VSVLNGLGLDVAPTGRVTKSGADVKCECCGKSLTADHFGAALPGSRLLYCDAPACLVKYVRAKIRAGPSTGQPRLDLGNLHG